MNLYIKFALIALVSLIIGFIVAILWAKFSLYIGKVLKQRYVRNNLAFRDFHYSSYHSGNQRQNSCQQINTTKSIKSFNKFNHHGIMFYIDRIFEPLYRHFDSSPDKQQKNTNAKTKDYNGNPESLINIIHSDTNANTKELPCQPKKNDTGLRKNYHE